MSAGTREIAIFGAGGFGREIACLIRKINEAGGDVSQPSWNFIGFFDDSISAGTRNQYGEILGGIKELNAFSRPLGVVPAVASPNFLKEFPDKVANPRIFFPNLIAPDVVFLDRASVNFGVGNIIGWGSRISCNVVVGNFNIAVGDLTLGHDCTIGDGNTFFPETRISGKCVVGNGNFFGMRSAVLQFVRVGNDTRIGAGAFVMSKTKDGFLYLGNPARKTEI